MNETTPPAAENVTRRRPYLWALVLLRGGCGPDQHLDTAPAFVTAVYDCPEGVVPDVAAYVLFDSHKANRNVRADLYDAGAAPADSDSACHFEWPPEPQQ